MKQGNVMRRFLWVMVLVGAVCVGADGRLPVESPQASAADGSGVSAKKETEPVPAPKAGGDPIVTLPKEVKIAVGRLAAVLVDYDADSVKWRVPGDLDVFREYDTDATKIRLRLIGYVAGKYELVAVAARGGKLSEWAVCTIIVGEPGPGPGPGPDPPAPTPGPLRVLMVYEKDDLNKMTAEQRLMVPNPAAAIRDYLNAKCIKGPDGKTPEWRAFDQNTKMDNESETWKRVMGLPRKSLPWAIIGNGTTGYEGPLPGTVSELLALLKKYGG